MNINSVLIITACALAGASSKIVVAYTGDKEAFKDTLNAKLGGRLSAVENSWEVVKQEPLRVVLAGVVAPRPEIKALAAGDESHYRSISGNVFMDEEHNIWEVKRTEAGNLVVKSNSDAEIEDLQSYLTSLCSASRVACTNPGLYRSVSSVTKQQPQGGAFVKFLNMFGSISIGFVAAQIDDEYNNPVDKALIVDNKGVEHIISNSNIITDYPLHDLPKVEASISQLTAQSLIDYYRRLYGSYPEFFSQLEQLIVERTFA